MLFIKTLFCWGIAGYLAYVAGNSTNLGIIAFLAVGVFFLLIIAVKLTVELFDAA